MDYHYHARLTIVRREELAKGVSEGRLSLKEAMAEFKLSRQSAAKWVRRYREQGLAGLRDRTTRPHRLPRSTPEEKIMEVERLRRERWTGVRIAQQLGLSRATVSRVLRRLGLNRIRDLEPAPAVVRYEHAAPGDMLHLDIKRLVRIQRPSHRVTGTAATASSALVRGVTRLSKWEKGRRVPAIHPLRVGGSLFDRFSGTLPEFQAAISELTNAVAGYRQFGSWPDSVDNKAFSLVECNGDFFQGLILSFAIVSPSCYFAA
jgi:transposase